MPGRVRHSRHEHEINLDYSVICFANGIHIDVTSEGKSQQRSNTGREGNEVKRIVVVVEICSVNTFGH